MRKHTRRLRSLRLAASACALLTALPLQASEARLGSTAAPAVNPQESDKAKAALDAERAKLEAQLAALSEAAKSQQLLSEKLTSRQKAELKMRLAEAERALATMKFKLAGRNYRERYDSARALYDSVLVQTDRPRLGVTIDTEDDEGARLLSVRPGGPAHRAGLRRGDLITHLGGQNLVGGQRSPGNRLIAEIRSAEEGEELQLRYRRSGKTYDANVTPERLERYPEEIFSRIPAPAVAPVAPRALLAETLPRFGLWGRWQDMELVPMNEGLESYFGVGEGLLVIEPPSDNDLLQLEAGDVVLAVGDRVPRNATHMLRILRSYESGETVRLQVMRQKRRETVSFELPERVGGLELFGPEAVLPPEPLVAPAAPAAVIAPEPAPVPDADAEPIRWRVRSRARP